MTDYDALRLAELAAISETAHQLTDEQWDAPSLCEGWRVRDVISHMCLGYTTPMPLMVLKMGRYGFRVPVASKRESIAYADARTPAQILAGFDTIHRDGVRKGISRVIKPSEGLLDHVVHHQDVLRPLGLSRTIPPERLLAALDVAPGLSGFVGSKKRAAGLRLVATDVDWSAGEGPEVRGTGEALLLAMTGRPVVLPELSGPGAGLLKERLAA